MVFTQNGLIAAPDALKDLGVVPAVGWVCVDQADPGVGEVPENLGTSQMATLSLLFQLPRSLEFLQDLVDDEVLILFPVDAEVRSYVEGTASGAGHRAHETCPATDRVDQPAAVVDGGDHAFAGLHGW